MIPVSSYTGEGIEELRQAIFALIDKNSQIQKADIPPRIPVDRIFSVEGFGTVITGTLIEGTLKVGDPVTVYPPGWKPACATCRCTPTTWAGGLCRPARGGQPRGFKEDRPQ